MPLNTGNTRAKPTLTTRCQRGASPVILSNSPRVIALMALAISVNVNAQNLTDAVNAQLANDPLPCARLLEGESGDAAFLTGGLADICARAVPQGSVSQSAGGGSASPGTRTGNLDVIRETEEQGAISGSKRINAQWSLFFSAESEVLDRKITAMEDGFDSDSTRLMFGSSYALDAQSVISLAVTTAEHTGKYSGGGEFDTESTGIRMLGAFNLSDTAFINLAAGVDRHSTEQTRAASFRDIFNNASIFSVTGAPQADFDIEQQALAIETGFNLNRGRANFSPYLGVNWVNNNYDTYSEMGGSGLELTIHDDQRRSLQSAVGLLTSMAFNTSFGAIIPQLDMRWKHEFDDKSRKVKVSFTGDSRAKQFSYQTEAADKDFFEVGAGAVLVFAQGKQAFINAQTLLGHEYYDNYMVSAGFTIEL